MAALAHWGHADASCAPSSLQQEEQVQEAQARTLGNRHQVLRERPD